MPHHCRSILSTFIPTMFADAQGNISSLYKWEMEAWSDVVVDTQQQQALPVGQNLEQLMIYPILGKGLWFWVLCTSPSDKTYLQLEDTEFGMQHHAQGAELSVHNLLMPPPLLPSVTAATEQRDTRGSFRWNGLTLSYLLCTKIAWTHFLSLKATLWDLVKILFQ